LNEQVVHTVYTVILIQWITYIMHFILQSMSADSVRDAIHRR